MRKIVVAVVLGCILALGLGVVVSAQEPPVPTPSPPPQWWEDDSAWFYYAEDEPFHWGLALYYEQPVLVNYVVEGRDFFVSEKSYYNLQMRGTAKIYEVIYDESTGPLPGNLVDERLFKGKITFRDPHNTWGWPPRGWPYEYIFYQYEQFDMNWTMPGVYRADLTCKDGHWTISFVVHRAPPVRGGMFANEPPWEFDAPIP